MKVLNLYECANRLQLPAKWLKDNALSGKIPYLRIGKRDMRFNLGAVKKAVADLAANKPKNRTSGKQELIW